MSSIYITGVLVTSFAMLSLVSPKAISAEVGSIRVCKVIANAAGDITTGSAQPGRRFTASFFAPSQFEINRSACTSPDQPKDKDPVSPLCPASGVPPTTNFITPLTLNTKLSGFPSGPGGGNNAMCKTYTNLPMTYYYANDDGSIVRGGQYFYRQESISGGAWESPLYNDGYSVAISESNLFEYNSAWFDNNADNNPPITRRNNEGAIILTNIKLDDDQIGGQPKDRTLVLFNQEKTITTPTPKPATPTPKPRSPTPSPTRSPSTRPSATPTRSPAPRTPSPTPTRSPSPTPTPIPTPRAPTKQIGKLEGLPLSLTPLTTVNKGTAYWVKLTIYGNNSVITVNENINSAFFTIIPPSYNEPAHGQTLRITRPSSGYETEVQNTICPDTSPIDGTPDCVSSVSTTSFSVALPTLSSSERRFIYFKVIPTNTSNSTTIDAAASVLTYPNVPVPVPLPPGGPVAIDDSTPFFQVFGGDVWSASPNANSIISLLTSGSQFFANTLDSIIFHLSGADYGLGEVSPKQWEASQYPKIQNVTYNELYEQYKEAVKPQEINSSVVTTAGYYEDTGSNGKLVLKSSEGWGTSTTPLIVDKKIVIFVNGNLYLDSGVNIQVKKDGKSSLAFIVSGRIGIHPSITNLQGIYIADGIIDTACKNHASGQGNAPCNPDKYDSSATAALTLEGVYAAMGGFRLDRTGVPGSVPGEKFVYRPDMIIATTDLLGREHYSWNENNK